MRASVTSSFFRRLSISQVSEIRRTSTSAGRRTRTTKRRRMVLGGVLGGALCALAAPAAAADAFWAAWGDGKAELDGYQLKQPRYGQPRDVSIGMLRPTQASLQRSLSR